jgi:GT2 family glycosyltransferase
MDLSVVIASYETRELLLSCLESVAAARRARPERSVEVIVVDNGSSDGSARAALEAHPDLRLIALVRNLGFAAAVNLGLRRARGRSILLLNSDVEVCESLLSEGVRLLDQHPDVGVLGPSLLHPEGRPQRSVHALPSLRTELLPDFLAPGSGRPGSIWSRSPTPRPGSLDDVEAVRGAVFFLRADLLEKVGLFNERFFFFLEETEYCARVRRAGYRVVQARDLKATHRLGASSKRRAPLATRIEYHRSLYRFLEIERGLGTARIVRILRILRGSALLVVLALAYPLSASARQRLAERWGLLLWHLRGCPDEPRLADVLDGLIRGGIERDRGGAGAGVVAGVSGGAGESPR